MLDSSYIEIKFDCEILLTVSDLLHYSSLLENGLLMALQVGI